MKAVIGSLLAISCVGPVGSAWGQAAMDAPYAGRTGSQAEPAKADPVGIWKTVETPNFTNEKCGRVKDVTLMRGGMQIALTEGVIAFAQPAAGHVFAAVFRGHGFIHVEAPSEQEKGQLRLFIGQDVLDTLFTELVLTFSDDTYGEVSRHVEWDVSAADPAFSRDYQERMQNRENYGGELMPRLVKGLLSENRKETELFYVDVRVGDRGWIFARLDALDPEEIEVGRWVYIGALREPDIWMHFPRGGRTSAAAWSNPLAREDVLPESYDIWTTVTSGADLESRAVVHLQAQWSGERMLHFLLDSNLRVTSVQEQGRGESLVFIQPPEQKDRAQAYGRYVAVFLPAPLEAGTKFALEFTYGGKREIRSLGPGVFFCPSFGWYPTRHNFALRSDFRMTFHSPKRYSLVATGEKTSEATDGGEQVTTWKSEQPIAVAGFAFGDFKLDKSKLGDIDVEVYANKEPDDQMRAILGNSEGAKNTDWVRLRGHERTGYALGNLSPAELSGEILTNTVHEIEVFQDYFGPYPYKRLAVTTIPYSYGQGWPSLLYISVLSFMDSYQRRQFGYGERGQLELTDFFRAHETSHQWWGHKVSWKSYHDQWLSEGFANFSGILYLQVNRGASEFKDYADYFRQTRLYLETKNEKGHVLDSVGPIWMGQRLRSSEANGNSAVRDGYSEVVYGKGGYVLHMLRMMLFDPQSSDPDLRFKEMMQDFTWTYAGQAASTEDFRAIVEKHMTEAMDIERNHQMDWFFQEYVYGTGIPRYEFHYGVQEAGGGQWRVTGSVTRSGVPDSWKDLLPMYMHRLKSASRTQFITVTQPHTSFEFIVAAKPDKITLNDFEDILADIKQ